MTKCFTAAFLVISTLLAAQTAQRTVSGRLTGNDGEPLPGVNIVIKGTATGTTTDLQGNYSLTAPIGSTLVFSFIGMKTREVLVTQNNLVAVTNPDNTPPRKEGRRKLRKPPPFTLAPDATKSGVAVLNDETPTYLDNGQPIDPEKIRSIKRVLASPLHGNRTYRVRMTTAPGYSIQFTSSFGIEKITQTPSLQKVFAQGRSQNGALQWSGPETREVFSWGPPLKTLEYDGSQYNYDNNGMLVPATGGNGKSARSYDANEFFRTGFNTSYNLTASFQRERLGTITVDATRKKQSGIIPDSESTQDHIMLQVKRLPFGKRWNVDVNSAYDRSLGSLVNRGGNFAAIAGAVWRTPASFDNTNGLSPRSAAASPLSSRFADGSPRSHALVLGDNPFGLVQEFPDEDRTRRILTATTIRYLDKKDFSVTVNGTFEKQWNDVVSGVMPGRSGFPSGRLSRRHEDQKSITAGLTALYKTNLSTSGHFEFSTSYEHSFQQRYLDRADGFGFTDDNWTDAENGTSGSSVSYRPERSIDELLLNVDFLSRDNAIILRLSNRSYFSNTLSSRQYSNFFPHLRAKLDLCELFETDSYTLHEFEIFGSFARTLHEAPLIYSNWSYYSTRNTAGGYNSFYEGSELLFTERLNLSPETEKKFETGFRFRMFQALTGQVAFHNNVTSDLLAPVWDPLGVFRLSNAARVNSYGTTVSLSWLNSYWYYGRLNWGINLRWARQNSVVRELYGYEDIVPLAGFSTAAKVLAEGKPVGAIYGRSYRRDAAGKVVIGNDGFPMMDYNKRTMIGNPIPDWTGGIDLHIEWKKIRLQCVFDIRKGGDVWNGTHAALDYLGRSATTGQERNISQYIFDGVKENGQPNTTPVSFYDPALPVDENRWVRYGFDGVAESYIEDSSWIRLSELAAAYTMRFSNRSVIRQLKFSLIANNLFQVTGYSGVDPASSLFGYAGSTGLDLFNTPSTRTFTAKMVIKI